MAEILDSGHVVTDEDVDTARLIIELDRALGRSTDSRTQRVAATPASHVHSILDQPTDVGTLQGVNGHPVEAAEELARTLVSEENAAELAREVGEQLPADMDPAEQQRVVSQIEGVIQRRLVALVRAADPRVDPGR